MATTGLDRVSLCVATTALGHENSLGCADFHHVREVYKWPKLHLCILRAASRGGLHKLQGREERSSSDSISARQTQQYGPWTRNTRSRQAGPGNGGSATGCRVEAAGAGAICVRGQFRNLGRSHTSLLTRCNCMRRHACCAQRFCSGLQNIWRVSKACIGLVQILWQHGPDRLSLLDSQVLYFSKP